jgi:NAD(P)-dependent dehydrogenase (short-subunit alcohol dehydrogenase family)
MNKIAVVAGAGSGVGRAVVLRMARESWSVALIGRTRGSLEETIHFAGSAPGKLVAFPCDIGDETSIADAASKIAQSLGTIAAVVNSAGTNIPNRKLDVLSVEDFDKLLATNLNGAFYLAHAFLPAMRKAGRGTIVNIISDAGMLANAKAGAAYVASKFGLRGLTQAINIDERQNGIRACGIFPGDINTPLLDRRPVPPTPEQRQRMLQPEDVADCVMLAINLPDRAVVEELLLRPRA